MRYIKKIIRLRLTLISLFLIFLSSCGWFNVSVDNLNQGSHVLPLLKIQKDNFSNQLVISEGSTLVVYFVLNSAQSSDSKFNIILEGSQGEISSQFFNLSQNTLTILSGQTSAYISINSFDDTIYRPQSHWSLKLISQTGDIDSSDSLEFDLNDNDIIPDLAPTATLSNTPSNPSNTSALDIIVGDTNVDFYQYKIGPSLSTFCNVNLGYTSDVASTIHILDNLTGFPDGSLTLCVLGKDSSGKLQDYESATSYTWIKDTLPPTAILTGTPSGTNNTTSLNVFVSGADVTSYQFKVGETSTTTCSDGTGYSADVAVEQNIQSNISGLSNTSITLCVIGKDAAGNFQPFASSTSTSWTKDTARSTITSVNTSLPNGAYKAGTQIDLSIQFSKVVSVSGGTPSLDLNSGIGAKANYLSGSNSNTLVFRYIVGLGDSSSDLNYPQTTSLSLNGASIQDSSKNDANLTLPTLSSGNDLGSFKNIYIDTIVPNPPSGLAEGVWSNSTSQSPLLTFANGTDGQSGIASHEVKIYDTATSSDVTLFTTIVSGNSISSLSLIDGHTYNFVMRSVDNAGNYSSEVSSLDWTVDTTPPSAPGAITTGVVPLNFNQATPTFTFTNSTDAASGLSHYVIEIRKQSDSSVVKAYTKATGNGSGLSYSEDVDFLTSGETYYANIKAVDMAGNQSTPTQALTPWVAISCPTNFIEVPANPPYTSSGLCVAKYEMKVSYNDNTPVNDGRGVTYLDVSLYKPESRPSGTPWTRLTFSEVQSECLSMGAGYRLIKNQEWDAIANDIINQTSNWSNNKLRSGNSDGVIDANALNDGWTFVNSLQLLAASFDDSNGYAGTGNNSSQIYGSGGEQNRTFILSNGEVIWDLAGNAREHVDMDGLGGTLSYSGSTVTNYVEFYSTNLVNVISTLLSSNGYIYTANTFSPPNNTWTHAANNIGMFYVLAGSNSTKTVSRGGNFNSSNKPGLFAGDLDAANGLRGSSAGFRCVYQR